MISGRILVTVPSEDLYRPIGSGKSQGKRRSPVRKAGHSAVTNKAASRNRLIAALRGRPEVDMPSIVMPSTVKCGDPMSRSLDRVVHTLVYGLAALLLVVAAARADGGFAFETTPGRLPKNAVPIHYALELRPDLEKLTLAGSLVVDIEVREPTDRLVLSALDMTGNKATIDGLEPAARIAVDKDAQTVTLTFPRPISTGRQALRIAYEARINRFGRGVYSIDYRIGDERKRMIASHSEPADARRIFPGWDEPAFKATF